MWHITQFAFALADDLNNHTGFTPFETCRKYGAIVIIAHNHQYGRSFIFNDVANLQFNSETDTITAGTTFVVSSGLGGRATRVMNLERASQPYWATTFNSSYGALFADIDDLTARFYFKTIDGGVFDNFTIYAQ